MSLSLVTAGGGVEEVGLATVGCARGRGGTISRVRLGFAGGVAGAAT
jgi:hypothetical protein